MEESIPRPDLKREFTDALETIVPNIETYHAIKEVSRTDDLILAIRDPHVPFTIVKMTDVTLNACPAGRFKTFCEALKFNQTLRKLTVTIDDSECQALVDALNVNRTVTRVNMTVRYLDVDVERMLTCDTCQKLSDMMTRNRVLKKLQITVRGSCSIIFTKLGESFVRPQNTLVTLVVETKMGKLDFEHLVEALRQSKITALKIGYYFSLAQNAQASPAQCSAEGTQKLCDYIRQSYGTLEILKLRTPLTIEQTKQFAEMIEANPRSLKTFYYEASKSFEAVDIITRAVTYNRILRKFLIGCAFTTGNGYEVLFQKLLRKNKKLESFAILNSPNTKSMWKYIAEELKDNNTLRVLHLLAWTGKKSSFIQDESTASKIGPNEGQYGVDCIKDNQSLTKVVLDNVIQNTRFSTTQQNLNDILRRNRAKQNEAYKNMIVIMYNIARTTALPIDFWVHVFRHIQFFGINRDFGDILLNVFNDPNPRKVLD